MLLLLFALFTWTIFGLITRRIAEARGLKNPNTWFFAGFFLGIIALPIAYFWRAPKHAQPPPEKKPPPHLSRTHWYYLNEEHKQLGPLSLNAMQRAFRDEHITPNTYIWTDGMPEWSPLESHTDLTTHLADNH